MAKKQFKAESKRLLDLMINSIYTHKEILKPYPQIYDLVEGLMQQFSKTCFG